MIRRSLANRLPAFIALAAFVLTFVSPLDAIQDLRPGDDAACGGIQLVHGHTHTGIAAPVAPTTSGHCPYCHFLRAVSGASPTAIVAVNMLTVSQVAVSIPALRPTSTAIAHRASRAPPALVLA